MGPLRGARRRDDGSYETAATTRRRRRVRSGYRFCLQKSRRKY